MHRAFKYLLVFLSGGVVLVLFFTLLGKFYFDDNRVSESTLASQLTELVHLEEALTNSYCKAQYTPAVIDTLTNIAHITTAMAASSQIEDGSDHTLMVTYARLAFVYSKLDRPKEARRFQILANAYYRLSVRDEINEQPEDVIAFIQRGDKRYCRLN